VSLQGKAPGSIRFVAVVVSAFMAGLGVAACDTAQDYDYVTACIDRYGNRVPDSACAHAPAVVSHDYWMPGDAMDEWYYIPAGATVPPIGRPLIGGTRNTTRLTVPVGGGAPRAAVVQRGGGAPVGGGAVVRGGFGSSGGSKGGSGS
jgi:uncharacterized membrane protein YgcG